MNFGLTTDEKRFLFQKHKDTSYKELEKFQKELKKKITSKELEDYDPDKLFKEKFKKLKQKHLNIISVCIFHDRDAMQKM